MQKTLENKKRFVNLDRDEEFYDPGFLSHTYCKLSEQSRSFRKPVVYI